MIVDSAVYRAGARLALPSAHEDFPALRAAASRDGDFVWVGLHDPTPAEMERVSREFGLHHLAVEDSLSHHQRPKLELYDDPEPMLFLVLRTLWYVDQTDAVETGQVAVFMGCDFVVSVRQGHGANLHTARLNLEREAAVLGHGPSAVLYKICDRIVDDYELVADELQTDVDEVEASVFSDSTRSQDSQRIYLLKRELGEMRRAVNPLRMPMEKFAAGVVPIVSESSRHFFRDVADHVTRVSENVDTLDTLLSVAFDAHLARVSVQQNADMRKISAWVAIAGFSTLVAGIYGMNFEHMPELHWRFGYAFALAIMLAASYVLWRLFKRSGWL